MAFKDHAKVVDIRDIYQQFTLNVMIVTIKYIMAQYSTVRYSTVLYGTVRYCMVLYGTVRYCTVQYGTVWYNDKGDVQFSQYYILVLHIKRRNTQTTCTNDVRIRIVRRCFNAMKKDMSSFCKTVFHCFLQNGK